MGGGKRDEWPMVTELDTRPLDAHTLQLAIERIHRMREDGSLERLIRSLSGHSAQNYLGPPPPRTLTDFRRGSLADSWGIKGISALNPRSKIAMALNLALDNGLEKVAEPTGERVFSALEGFVTVVNMFGATVEAYKSNPEIGIIGAIGSGVNSSGEGDGALDYVGQLLKKKEEDEDY